MAAGPKIAVRREHRDGGRIAFVTIANEAKLNTLGRRSWASLQSRCRKR